MEGHRIRRGERKMVKVLIQKDEVTSNQELGSRERGRGRGRGSGKVQRIRRNSANNQI